MSKGHIGTATLRDGKVSFWIRAAGRGVVGDYRDTVSVATFERQGWITDGPLVEGQAVKVLPSD